ncbi:MAG TPA: SpoIID/LytB domain-containing protein [Candidatus Limnocylindria bacterium]|nr:SpoIID/LytB domain-containing protein [Candidatus Limnocylindria bacterium]
MPHFLPVRRISVRPVLPRSLGLLLALAMLLPAAASAPAPVSAAGSCTGWTSRYTPPETIRVGRANGTVEVVDFRTYVGVVMAKEWPGWVPEQAREAGAVAVKQYAWYYTLEGKHRSSYVNANGRCFDVRDSTVDQLYRPEQVTVGQKIWRVVDATWGLSVRKDGKFFLTGYRAGSSGVCASDVDGRRLFAKSVIDCAERGWSRERIQRTYYAPNVSFHWSAEQVAPTIGLDVVLEAPTAGLRTGKDLSQKHALVRWDGEGNRPEGTFYQLQRLSGGKWSNVSLPDATQPSVALRLAWDRTHAFRVRLRDGAGNFGPWFAGPRFDARLVQDRNERMGWSPDDWAREDRRKASGGTVTYSTQAGSQSALTFTGRAVGLVSTMGPNRGRAEIFVDGRPVGEINLYSPTYRWRVLVFAEEWAESARRVIRIDVLETPDRPRVDVDGILFYH